MPQNFRFFCAPDYNFLAFASTHLELARRKYSKNMQSNEKKIIGNYFAEAEQMSACHFWSGCNQTPISVRALS